MMKVRLFPDGKVHSAYLDLINNPPEGVEYVGEYSYAPGSAINIGGSRIVGRIFDVFDLPYVVPFESEYFVHSCQKLIKTKSNFIIDIEHGNPFMGANNINKNGSGVFRSIVSKILLAENCKGIIPWSAKAANAFRLNFGFLGDRFLNNKVMVARPTVAPCYTTKKKFDEFTFLFIGGQAFFAKGGLQVLEAFNHFKNDGGKSNLIVVGETPEHIRMKYEGINELFFYGRMQRDLLLDLMLKCHCLVQPSVGDTYGMSILEAKSRKLPAIVVDSFAEAELVENKKTGIVLKPDANIRLRFDTEGRKILSKDDFHSQFWSYSPSYRSVFDLMYAMQDMSNRSMEARRMGEKAFEDIDGGRLSVGERNIVLNKAYGGKQ